MTTLASPPSFHDGERRLQRLAGSEEVLAQHGPQLLRPYMPEQHREFFAKLPFVIVGALDADGQPWATVWSGPPGFVSSPDPRTLVIETHAMPAGDPLARIHAAATREAAAPVSPGPRAASEPGAVSGSGPDVAGDPIALLGIEPHTRRRNRANGRIRASRDGRVEVEVRQSFGNCPKYIVPRKVQWDGAAATVRDLRSGGLPAPGGPADSSLDTPVTNLGPQLDEAAIALITGADTLFIASAAPGARSADAPPASGLDVSHRAGAPGFVQVGRSDDGVELRIPDFPGNRFFNTLGNLLLDPRAGLLLIDFASRDLLWIAGIARIEAADAGAAVQVPAVQRWLVIKVNHGVFSANAVPLRFLPVAA